MFRLIGQSCLHAVLFAAIVLGTLPASNFRLVRTMAGNTEQEGERHEEQSESVDVCRQRETLPLALPSDQAVVTTTHRPRASAPQLDLGAIELAGHRLANGQMAALRI